MREMKDDRAALLDSYLEHEKWPEARGIIRDLLRKQPDSHWLLTNLALTYYEQRKYAKALEISKAALKTTPNCPLVLWNHAGTLEMLGRRARAIQIYRTLIQRGSRRRSYGNCWESARWTESLVNDCRYRLALCYRDLGRKNTASRYFGEHLRRRRPGVPSIYSRKEVLEKLNQLRSS
ncbi:MAG: tetratricopeptide repeat protein [Candidatus Zixiibacteriota bacterium]